MFRPGLEREILIQENWENKNVAKKWINKYFDKKIEKAQRGYFIYEKKVNGVG